ncbi:DNA gyrase inhibitor [Anaerolineae bacterium]|nr:DNA gyrase inhibitor [Anaerolineae bacterium]
MPKIKHFPKLHVASVTEIGAFGEAIPRGFSKLFAWLDANNLQPLGASLGIFHDDPMKVPVEKLRSELCVPVAPEAKGSGAVEVKEIGDFEAATITYQGNANIVPAYNEVYDWLRAQGYRDNGALFEVYLSKLGEEIRAEVYVPIVKAGKRGAKQSAKKLAAKNKAAKK